MSVEYSVPVVVIGAGACGLTAALAAKEAGAEVLVLERDAKPAGSTALSTGLIPGAGTRYQKALGIAPTTTRPPARSPASSRASAARRATLRRARASAQ